MIRFFIYYIASMLVGNCVGLGKINRFIGTAITIILLLMSLESLRRAVGRED